MGIKCQYIIYKADKPIYPRSVYIENIDGFTGYICDINNLHDLIDNGAIDSLIVKNTDTVLAVYSTWGGQTEDDICMLYVDGKKANIFDRVFIMQKIGFTELTDGYQTIFSREFSDIFIIPLAKISLSRLSNCKIFSDSFSNIGIKKL
jgi:hypothetical protein